MYFPEPNAIPKKSTKVANNELYPSTPPPSPRGTASPVIINEDNLVHINVVLKAPRHPGLNVSVRPLKIIYFS